MKVPKYIVRLLEKRRKLAEELNTTDMALTVWLDKNEIKVEDCDYMSGYEMYCNPGASMKRIIKAIEDK